jgi:PelA/Pel-15E family pectate lyase
MSEFATAGSPLARDQNQTDRWDVSRKRVPCIVALLLLAVTSTQAAEFRMAEPVTRERVLTLPPVEQKAWLNYLATSEQHFAAEKAGRAAEAKANGLTELKLAPYATVFGVNLNQPVAWFATDEGRRVTANILSYQTLTGGFSKRLDYGKGPRLPGVDFVSEKNAHYEGTFDNDATTTHVRALARAVQATDSAAAREAFFRGLNYVFLAQYPNGGWPQIYPLEGGYHDSITFNDDVASNILALLADVAAGKDEFAFVPEPLRREARERVQRGLAAVLACQIKVDGRLTGWCQQHDALTLQPVAARAFEPQGICSQESASLMGWLMTLPNPDAKVVATIEGAAAWFEKTKITGFAWRNSGDQGRLLVPDPNAGPLWSRIYEIGTDRPIFGNPDKTVHYDVAEITRERRGGYNWYSGAPARQLAAYPAWKAKLKR